MRMGKFNNMEYRDTEERILSGREDYRRIPVPGEMRDRLEAGIARAEAERKRGTETEKRKRIRFRAAAAAAAAAAMLVVLPNTGAGVAHAMGSLPVVGKLFQAVTFRDYRYESERFDASVEVPQIVVEDAADDAEKAETVEQINFDIEKVTNQLIEEFQASAELGESYGTLEIHHETVTDDEKYFTLKLSIYQGAGSGYESYKLYTIDKRTGKQVQIGDLFREGSHYNELLSGNIQDQMRAKMAEDEYNVYWVDYEEVPEWNWEELKEDQNFYFDEAGNLVVVFDEYEVAPGYMGAQEFTVERSVFEEILK